MIKTSDFIHHNGSIPDFDYEMLNQNCKVVAIFKDTGILAMASKNLMNIPMIITGKPIER